MAAGRAGGRGRRLGRGEPAGGWPAGTTHLLLVAALLLHLLHLAELPLILVVDEVTPGAVGAKSDGVEGAAQFCLVLGVAGQRAQLVLAVRKLTLVAVFTVTVLLERPAKFRLVAARVHIVPVLLLLLLHG